MNGAGLSLALKLALRELREPLGWEWHEDFGDVSGRIAKMQERRNRPKPVAKKPEPPKKPRRDPPPL